MFTKISKTLLITAALCTINTGLFAQTTLLAPNYNFQAGTGTKSRTEIDTLFPISSTSTSVIYADVNARYASDQSNYAGFGLGTRQIVNDKIYGFYAFADRSRTVLNTQENNWLVMNLGAEMITKTIDARVNFYAPVGSHSKTQYGDTIVSGIPVGSVGMVPVATPAYLTTYGYNTTQEIPLGGDIDVGYQVNFLNARLHGGAYYYKYSGSDFHNILGGLAGIAFPIAAYTTLRFDGSYDNFRKSSGLVSIVFNFGATPSIASSNSLTDRLTDKVQRHFGTLYNGSGVPAQEKRNIANGNEFVCVASDNGLQIIATGC